MKGDSKTEIDLLIEISKKLDILIGSLLIQDKERNDQIKILANNGFSNSEIGKMLGIPKGTVDSIRAKFKKGK